MVIINMPGDFGVRSHFDMVLARQFETSEGDAGIHFGGIYGRGCAEARESAG
ncbi:hypothetical protein [Microbulbifer sp. THAF38]|uniref:hypothetical protein n=1 Tax=Microbulbifer sp. THAF38 TaxID=2587856 RepID=UPI001562B5C1|nr:hypothetical protein [Microbulbifer sp. THAF38]